MQLKVKLSFSEEQRQIITEFAKQVEMTVPEFCKRAVIYAINKSYEEAANVERSRARQPEVTSDGIQGTHDTESGITAGDIQPGLREEGPAPSDTLAEPETVPGT